MLPRGLSRKSRKIVHPLGDKLNENNIFDASADDIDISEEEELMDKKLKLLEPEKPQKVENSAAKLDVIAEDYEEFSNHGYGFDDHVNYEEMTGS